VCAPATRGCVCVCVRARVGGLCDIATCGWRIGCGCRMTDGWCRLAGGEFGSTQGYRMNDFILRHAGSWGARAPGVACVWGLTDAQGG
jgi:hypothetical protein